MATIRTAAADTGFIAAAFLWRNVFILTALGVFFLMSLARP